MASCEERTQQAGSGCCCEGKEGKEGGAVAPLSSAGGGRAVSQRHSTQCSRGMCVSAATARARRRWRSRQRVPLGNEFGHQHPLARGAALTRAVHAPTISLATPDGGGTCPPAPARLPATRASRAIPCAGMRWSAAAPERQLGAVGRCSGGAARAPWRPPSLRTRRSTASTLPASVARPLPGAWRRCPPTGPTASPQHPLTSSRGGEGVVGGRGKLKTRLGWWGGCCGVSSSPLPPSP